MEIEVPVIQVLQRIPRFVFTTMVRLTSILGAIKALVHSAHHEDQMTVEFTSLTVTPIHVVAGTDDFFWGQKDEHILSILQDVIVPSFLRTARCPWTQTDLHHFNHL